MPAWENAETFEEYLTEKKIDASAWQTAEPKAYAEQAALFAQLGAKSFDQRAKFLIMDWRLRFSGLISNDQQTVHTRDW